MPASVTFFQTCLFLFSAFARWSVSTPLKRADCPGYKASNVQQTDDSVTADLTLAGTACTVYGKDLTDLKFLAEYQTDSRLHIIIYDNDEQVYQVPESVVPRPGGTHSADSSLLQVSIEEEPFSFTVTRKATNEVLFTTKGSPIVFEDKYLRVRTSLPANPLLYGLGEHTDSLQLPTSNYVRTLWARDAPDVPERTNLYGTHPVYYEHRPDSGDSHAVLLLNSNGMDIKINNDSGQYLEYNALGGVIDLYFMGGPSPFDVSREYSEISQKAAMMPYWGFGFHQCRFGYHSVDDVSAVVENYAAANIPLETMWTDIDYMHDRWVFTLNETNFPLSKMRDLVSRLHDNNQHYIVMVDPAVAYRDYGSFNRGRDANAFLKNTDGNQGRVWPGLTAFPDWFHPNTQGYWDNEFAAFFSPTDGVDIDALWIDMNEPSNFCTYPCFNPAVDKRAMGVRTEPVEAHGLANRQTTNPHTGLPNRNLFDPPYSIQNAAVHLSNRTINTTLIHYGGYAEYDTHNLYGTMMSKTSRGSMLQRRPDKRPMVITRSTFVGAGSYVGHWLGDNDSSWDQYIISIRHLLQFASFFQIPMVGADVCGFNLNTTEELCARWTRLGAFYPFYRNHNSDQSISQEAYRWASVAESARKAIDLRYRLLDYIYTAMYQQTVDGTPSAAPLWMHYPSDPATFAIDKQFFYGPSILVSPVTDQGSTSVAFYLPNDTFYDLDTLKKVQGTGATVTYTNIGTTDIPVHICGGSIIPARVASANTTTALREQDFELWVAPDADGKATGTLYLDDGESLEQSGTSEITFSYEGSTLKMNGTFGYSTKVGIKSVTVMGDGDPRKVEIDEGLDGPFKRDLSQ